MSHSIQCTHCQAVLKSPTAVPAGKKVKCPKCQQVFTTGEAAAPPPAPEPVPAPAMSEDDEMAAAIAKLEAESSAKKPEPSKEELDKIKAPAIAARGGTLQADGTGVRDRDEEEVPEVDDDLVEADDDLVEEDEPPAKKKKKRDDDDDDSSDRKKKRRDEDEDDEPRSKKKSRKDDDDEEEEPRPKKKSRKDDDDDDDDRPRKKEPAKSGGGMMMILGIVGGVLFLLIACGGCGVGGVFLMNAAVAPDIVGKWEEDNIIKIRYEFRGDGTGTMDAIVKLDFRYKQEGSKLSLNYTDVDIGGFAKGKVDNRSGLVYIARREGDFLYLREESKTADLKLKKVR